MAGPVRGQLVVDGLGVAGALPVVLVGVSCRRALASSGCGADLQFEAAQFAGDEHGALVGVVLLRAEQVPGQGRELAGGGDDRDLGAAAGLDAQVVRLQRAGSLDGRLGGLEEHVAGC